jgi:hypothetical protein
MQIKGNAIWEREKKIIGIALVPSKGKSHAQKKSLKSNDLRL